MKNVSAMLGVLLLLIVTACDVIDNPVQQGGVPPPDTSADFKQNVLLEDYTGHTCGNCPEAADVAHQIQSAYGDDRVIVVAVHSGPFARTNQSYPTDWRTPEGTEMDNTFRISMAGNPNGLVNRTERSGKFILSKDDWAPATVDLLDNDPALGIELEKTWNAENKTISVTARLTFLKEGTTDYHIVGWIIENGLVGDQLDYRKSPSHIEDFEFEHVLRASVNGTWGEPVLTETQAAGTVKSWPMQFTFPSEKDWKPENCDLVVFVHKHNTTKEVVQVVKTKIVD